MVWKMGVWILMMMNSIRLYSRNIRQHQNLDRTVHKKEIIRSELEPIFNQPTILVSVLALISI